MKVISSKMTWDFTDVKRISYRQSIMNAGFPIEIERPVSSLFFISSVEEIARVKSQARAQRVVNVLTENWAADTPLFDLDAWLQEDIAKYPWEMSHCVKELSALADETIKTHSEIKDLEQQLAEIEESHPSLPWWKKFFCK